MDIRSSDIEIMERMVPVFATETIPTLRIFSTFIASNVDFKYNATYLSDAFDAFFQQVDSIVKRKLEYTSKRADIVKELIPCDLSGYDTWLLILDDLFVISNLYDGELKTITDIFDEEKSGTCSLPTALLGKLHQTESFSLYDFDKAIKKVERVLQKEGSIKLIEDTWARTVR